MNIAARGRFARRLPEAALLVVVLSLSACEGTPKSSVSGKVTLKGEPVTAGSVNFVMAEKGIAAQGTLDANGSYKLEGDIQPGTYKVYFSPPLPEQLPPGQVSKRPPFKVPQKYQDPATSTITKEVKGGANDIPIEIPD